jgi:hypothetical protein
LGWEAGPEAPFGAPWPDAVVMQFFEALLELKKSPNAKVETDTKVDPVPAR